MAAVSVDALAVPKTILDLARVAEAGPSEFLWRQCRGVLEARNRPLIRFANLHFLRVDEVGPNCVCEFG